MNINTLYTALFTDLTTKKDDKLPTQQEKRERKLQSLIKERNKPIALFIRGIRFAFKKSDKPETFS